MKLTAFVPADRSPPSSETFAEVTPAPAIIRPTTRTPPTAKKYSRPRCWKSWPGRARARTWDHQQRHHGAGECSDHGRASVNTGRIRARSG